MSLAELICRQTSYTLEEAEQKLKDHNNDVLKVLREFIEPVKPTIVIKDANQVIMDEINNFMKPVFNKL
jgi:hypothetical protein